MSVSSSTPLDAPVPPLATASTPSIVIVPLVVIGEPVTVRPVVPPESATLVTVPDALVTAAHVESSRKKRSVEVTGAGTKPARLRLKFGSNVAACVPVNASTLPVLAVTRPRMVLVAVVAILAKVTAFAAIVSATVPTVEVASPV